MIDATPNASPKDDAGCRVSVVMPCLNEAKTVVYCVKQAMTALREEGLDGEVVVSDNGSTDGSQQLAREAGARVVDCPDKGYGNALAYGIHQAKGRVVIMGDSDMSYDFSQLAKFVKPIEEQGADLVMGNRFRGGIQPGAMPWKNRYIGNPGLTFLMNVMFRTGAGDSLCGLRSFSKDAFRRMQTNCPGMEFAVEMVVKSARRGLKIMEVPTTLAPDGRGRPPHLKPFRDGWRVLKFLLMSSPLHLFLLPGALLALVGMVLGLIPVAGAAQIAGLHFDIHWMVLGLLLFLIGVQVAEFGILARVYSLKHLLDETDPSFELFQKSFRLEYGLILGVVTFLIGFGIDVSILYQWISTKFGELNQVRPALVATALMAFGVQTVFFCFLFAILNQPRGHDYQRAAKPAGI